MFCVLQTDWCAVTLRTEDSVYASLKRFDHKFCGLQILGCFNTWLALNVTSLLIASTTPVIFASWRINPRAGKINTYICMKRNACSSTVTDFLGQFCLFFRAVSCKEVFLIMCNHCCTNMEPADGNFYRRSNIEGRMIPLVAKTYRDFYLKVVKWVSLSDAWFLVNLEVLSGKLTSNHKGRCGYYKE